MDPQERAFWKHADTIAFSLPFGWFFGRLGCFSALMITLVDAVISFWQWTFPLISTVVITADLAMI